MILVILASKWKPIDDQNDRSNPSDQCYDSNDPNDHMETRLKILSFGRATRLL